ncbi:FMN-dependent NADH-azoreductase [compost metagenome]
MSKKILHIISSTRGAESFTNQMADAIIKKIKTTEGEVDVDVLDLSKEQFPHLSQGQINAFFLPVDLLTLEQKKSIEISDRAVEQIQQADFIVIGVPMYNFSINSSLKAYFDHIARAKITFRYSEKGAEGLLLGKKAFIAAGSAGVFTSGVNESFDFAIPYVKHFLSFIGITDVSVFRIEGTAIPEMQDIALQKTLASIEEYRHEVDSPTWPK